jgi:hypothetical protein
VEHTIYGQRVLRVEVAPYCLIDAHLRECPQRVGEVLRDKRLSELHYARLQAAAKKKNFTTQ